MRGLEIQSKKGSSIELRCEHQHGESFQYIAEIPSADITLRREYPWQWDTEQGQKVLVLGFQGSQRIATAVSSETEKTVNSYIEECEEWQQEEKQKLYQPLIDQLPTHEISTTGNDEKAQELLQEASEIKDVKGPEMDGVNMQQSMRRQAIRREAKQHCDHDIDTHFQYTFTGDARRKVIREMVCEKCGMTIIDEASEKVSEEAMWR